VSLELALEGRVLQMVSHQVHQELEGEGAEMPLVGPDLDAVAGLEPIPPTWGMERRDELEGGDAGWPQRRGPGGQLGVRHDSDDSQARAGETSPK
jgi:hypothetical protein